MPSWYDIVGLDERSNENCAGLEDSVKTLRSILQTEHENYGLPYRRMVLAGFSQGGALSLYTGLQLTDKIAGVVVLSGYLPAASKFKVTPGLEKVPVLHCHGTQDMVVPSPLAEKSRKHVMDRGAKEYTLKTYPIAHTVSMEELADVLRFVQTVLPPDETCRVKVKDPSEMTVKELKAAIRKAGIQSKAVGFMEKREFVGLLEDFRAGKL